MVHKLYPPIFYAPEKYRSEANILKTQTSILANGSYKLVSINGQAGKLGQVSANLDSQTAIRLVIIVDGAMLVNHTPADVEGTGSGKLALEIPNAFDSFLRTTKSASNNYAITFMPQFFPVDFQNRCEVNLINDTTSAVDLQAAYALWAILRRSK